MQAELNKQHERMSLWIWVYQFRLNRGEKHEDAATAADSAVKSFDECFDE